MMMMMMMKMMTMTMRMMMMTVIVDNEQETLIKKIKALVTNMTTFYCHYLKWFAEFARKVVSPFCCLLFCLQQIGHN